MKVKICVCKEMEIEVNSSAIAELDNFWRTNPEERWGEADALAKEAVKDIETATNLPFDSECGEGETIFAVYAMDGEPILEA